MNQALRSFLYPRVEDHGQSSPEELVFDVTLHEFAMRVDYISNLHIGGKLSSDEAFQQISSLWHNLEQSKPK